MIVAITSSKGGAGKTTLTSIAAASIYAKTDLKVVMVDLDPQKSLTSKRNKDTRDLSDIHTRSNLYRTMAGNIEKKQKPFADIETLDLFSPWDDIKKKLNGLDSVYDVVFVDFPGSLNLHDNTLRVLRMLDFIFVPVYVDENSFDSTYPFIKSLKAMKLGNKIKGNTRAFFNLYQEENGKNGAEFVRVGEFLESQNVDLMDNHVYESIDVQRYHTVIPPRESSYRKNIHNWIDEIIQTITN